MKYILLVKTTQFTEFLVEAESVEEAIARFTQDGGEYLDAKPYDPQEDDEVVLVELMLPNDVHQTVWKK